MYFQEVNIKGADFRGAKFGPVSFLKANEPKNFMGYVFNVNFNESQLEGADFRGADLSGSIFLGAKHITEAYFDEEYLAPCYLRKGSLFHAVYISLVKSSSQ